MSDYVRQNSNFSEFNTAESWVILSEIEQRIKDKIEAVGTPLRNWDINIYRGILTGYNEAFIIDSKKKEELIKQDPKSAEIIKPLLRGRDVKRYSSEFANLHLITTIPSLKIDIELYPAIKQHLMSFGYDRLKQTGDRGARKKTNNKWFETQDTISYWEDFFKPKMLWAETMRVHKQTEGKFPRFGYDKTGNYLTDKTCFFATGKDISYIIAVLNSAIGKYLCYQYVSILDDGGFLMQKVYVEKIPVPIHNVEIKHMIYKLLNNSIENQDIENDIDRIIYKLYDLTSEEIKFIESL